MSASFALYGSEPPLVTRTDSIDTGADLYWPTFFRANCRNCSFRASKLSGAVFDDSDLMDSDFTAAYVSFDTVHLASSFRGANLRGARLDGANLIGCLYDELTEFSD